jgi:hypothetical protein
MCVSPVLNKVLSYDIICQTKVNGAFLENDAIGCYDRLVNNLIFLELKRLGVPNTVLQCIQDTWNNACHHIKTKYGYSECTYQNYTERPLFGPGQGSTTGPPFWSILFCLIVKNLPPEAMDVFFQSVHKTIQIANKGDAFVDDAQLGCSAPLPSGHHDSSHLLTTTSIVDGLRHLAQNWERLLFTTGGALNLQKSFWVLLTWKWDKGVARLLTPAQAPAELQLTAGYNPIPVAVPRICPSSGFRTLGVHISPSGSLHLSIKQLRGASLNYANANTGSRLNRSATLWSYLMYLMPKLAYPTPALTLTQEECQRILSPSLMAVLPKLHVNRHTARSIVHGPASLGGLHLPTIFSEQSSGQLSYFTSHVGLGDKTGKLLLISLTYLQLLSGSCSPVLNLPFPTYKKWIEPSWLLSFWSFMFKVGYKITIKQQWVPTIPRKYDSSLMDQFLKLGFTDTQLCTLNRCRVYLQVIFLSDITSADGSIIIPECKQGVRLADRVSVLQWPIQERPSSSAWTLWTQALQHFENRNRLLIPLRQWVGETHQRWRWFVTPTKKHIFYRKDTDTWDAIPPHQLSTTRCTRSSTILYDIRQKSVINVEPSERLPVTLTATRQTHIYSAQPGPTLVTKSPTVLTPQTYEEDLLSQPIYSYIEEDTTALLASANVFLGIAAMQDEGRLIYGWSVYHTLKVWSDAGELSGRHYKEDTTAFLGGLLAGLTVLRQLPITSTVYIRIITKTLVEQLSTETPIGVTHMTCQDFDLIQAVRAAIHSLNSSCKVRLVPQEEQTAHEDALDRAKTEAFSKAEQCKTRSSPFAKAHGLSSIGNVIIERQGMVLAGNFRSLIQEDLYYDSLKDTIITKEKWSINVFPMVAWLAFSKAFRRLSRPRQITYAKLTHCLLQTNSRNHMYYGTTPLCPGCNTHEETLQHVWSCDFPATVAAREAMFDTYKTTLQDFPTPPQLIEVIVHGIQQWILLQNGGIQRQIAPTIANISLSAVTAAYTEQTTKIRWDAFLRGRVSLAWGSAYKVYFKDATDAEIQQWLSDLVRANMDLSLALWKHRNTIVHGADVTAQKEKVKRELTEQVVSAYRRYNSDPFIIPRSRASLFEARTLHQRLQQDIDCLRSWLTDIKLAMQLQADAQDRVAKVAKSFFVPRKYRSQNPPRENEITSVPAEGVESRQAPGHLSCHSPRSLEESPQEYRGWIDESATTVTDNSSLSQDDL